MPAQANIKIKNFLQGNIIVMGYSEEVNKHYMKVYLV
jgi:hypothetical protein